MTAEAPWPVLALGGRNADVTTPRYPLRRARWMTPAADGAFGPAAEEAVRASRATPGSFSLTESSAR